MPFLSTAVTLAERSLRARPLRRFAGIALAGLALAACSVETVDPNAGSGMRPRPGRACTAEYRPVCAARGGESQTCANACMAQSSGFRILGPGECRDSRPERRPDERRACTREYAPVCATRGDDRQTFANACEARASGYDIIGRNECRRVPADRNRSGWREADRDGRGKPRADRSDRNRGDRVSDDRTPRVCTSEYNPVCAQQGRDRRTFGNACAAEVAGFSVVRPGECPAR